MTQFAVNRPLNERNLHDDLRPDPMCAKPRESAGLREERLRDFEFVQACPKVQQELCVEAGSDLAGKHEVLMIKVTDQQSPKTDATALRIRESTYDKFLRRFALHLQPMRRAAMLIRRRAQFSDHTFPSFTTRALPW